MLNYKSNITEIPTYLDGYFLLFKICQTNSTNPKEYLHPTKIKIWFEELSITDKLKLELDTRNKKSSQKIRISQTKEIDSLCVLKIGNNYYKVYNVYHFKNKDGFLQSDILLEEYYNPLLESDLNG